MLQVHNVTKIYKTEDFEQQALAGVTLNFRKSEFVSILGQSGSGKTTFLNIIGGLDQYTSGDVKINGQSTKKFKETEWDAYRNNSIGFIFQSYNLVSHLSLLDNVELGMTLSGVSKAERRKKAQEVLEEVGLKAHLNKRPSQLSGGQMQRVAIARALANDPDIILADEPTGALDTETSEQIMKLIKKIATKKLVIMVTHNPELAEKYSNRIVKFSDGKVVDDTNPYDQNEEDATYDLKKTSMNFLTALNLSGRNIITKKWRTSITAFASSIGIIGVALVLALSNGFDKQIDSYQQGALSNYPITISQGEVNDSFPGPPQESGKELEGYTNNSTLLQYDPNAEKEVHVNVLTDEYIEYVNEMDDSLLNGISMTRSINMPILKSFDGVATAINTRNVSFSTYPTKPNDSSTSYLEENYDLLAGEFPKDKTDLLLVVDEYNRVTTAALEELGILDDAENVEFDTVVGRELKLLYNDDYYVQDGDYFKVNGKADDLSDLYQSESAITLKISGIIRLKEDATVSSLSSGIVYSDELATDFIENAQQSQVALAQEEADFNVLTGILLTEKESSGSVSNGNPMESSPNDSTMVQQTKEEVLKSLGASEIPTTISLYPTNFDTKEDIATYLDSWNDGKADDEKIEYVDMSQTITEMTGSIMDTITLVLIAFASISLVVSMIMIGIIIYISVIERTKEIGVLRALGARKKDITRVFNAETFIIGVFSGTIGIVITYLLTIPVNNVIYNMTELANVAQLNPLHALGLVIVSVVLTMIGGFIPSKMAAKKDPVTALRSE